MTLDDKNRDEINVLKELDGSQFFVSQANLNRSYSEEFRKLTGYHGAPAILSRFFDVCGYAIRFYHDCIVITPYETAKQISLYMGISAREWIDQFPNVDIHLVHDDPDGSATRVEQATMERLMAGNPTQCVRINDGVLSVTPDSDNNE